MKKQHFIKIFSILGLICLVAFLMLYFADDSFARPGGGHGHHGGYSRGSGGYRGSYSGGYGGGVFILGDSWWIWLIIIVVYYVIKSIASKDEQETISSAPTTKNITTSSSDINSKLAQLIEIDPNFSKPIFLDFVSVLFTKFHYYAGEGQVQKLTPFFEGDLQNWEKYTISELSIASVRISDVELHQDGFNSILVTIDADYTTNMRPQYGSKSIRRSTKQNWLFARPENAVSVQPQGFGVLRCPNCGAPANFTDSGQCLSCGSEVSHNAGQWVVKGVKVLRMEGFNSQDMLDYAEEYGTDLPTIKSAQLKSLAGVFSQQHPDLISVSDQQNYVYAGFIKTIAEPYFLEIYQNWSDGTWNNVRHLVSDRQWQSMDLYMQGYNRLGYKNVLENVKILRCDAADYFLDNNYESITIRIFAQCLDYVVDKSGKKLAGNNRTPRVFSEYWTFVCKKGIKAKTSEFKKCPCCGAPADNMGQGGLCGYCGSKITDANFSWVLFSITQDEEYRG